MFDKLLPELKTAINKTYGLPIAVLSLGADSKDIDSVTKSVNGSVVKRYPASTARRVFNINGHLEPVTVDSGSRASLIHTSVARRLNIGFDGELKSQEVRLAMQGHAPRMQYFESSEVAIPLDDSTTITVIFRVSDDADPDNTLLGGAAAVAINEHEAEGKALTIKLARQEEQALVAATPRFSAVEEEKDRAYIMEKIGDLLKINQAITDPVKDLAIPLPFKERPPPGKVITAPNYRPHPFASKEQMAGVRLQVADMLDKGIISPIGREAVRCASTIIVVKQPGKDRIVFNFPPLNSQLNGSPYPMPVIDDILSLCSGARYIAKLDGKSAYLQIELPPEDRPYVCFELDGQCYSFNRCAFGLVHLPGEFQRFADEVAASTESCKSYLDDAILCSPDLDTHVARLRSYISECNKRNYKLGLEKCVFSATEVQALGFVVNGKGVTVDPAKTKSVVDFPRPTTRLQLHSFIGLVSYLRTHVVHLAQISASLVDWLTALNADRKLKMDWTPELSLAFLKVKAAVVDAIKRAHYDANKPLIIYTDASDSGIAAVLCQENDDGTLSFLHTYSRKLKKYERGYSTYKKEALSLVVAVCVYSPYFNPSQVVTVRTDHRALIYLFDAGMSRVIANWCALLTTYSISIEYIPGPSNVFADALSRSPDFDGEMPDARYLLRPAPEDDTSEGQAANDPFTTSDVELTPELTIAALMFEPQPLAKRASREERAGRFAGRRAQAQGELEFKQAQDRPLAVPADAVDEPASAVTSLTTPAADERTALLEKAHQETGHRSAPTGISFLLRQLRVSWPGMATEMHAHVAACEACSIFNRGKTTYAPALSHSVDVPMAKLFVDLHGPMAEGKGYFLVLVDSFTNFIWGAALEDYTAATIVSTLRSVFLAYGFPRILISDNGPCFAAEVFAEFMKCAGVEHHLVAPYTPRANGRAEKAVGLISQTLNKFLREAHSKDWRQWFPAAVAAHNQSVSSTTGCSPFALMFGRPYISASTASQSPIAANSDRALTPEEAKEMEAAWDLHFKDLYLNVIPLIRQRIESVQAMQRAQNDAGRQISTVPLRVNTWVRTCTPGPRDNNTPFWSVDTFKIVTAENNLYELATADDVKIPRVFHRDLLKPARASENPTLDISRIVSYDAATHKVGVILRGKSDLTLVDEHQVKIKQLKAFRNRVKNQSAIKAPAPAVAQH